MPSRLVWIGYKSIAGTDGIEEESGYLVFSVPDFFPFFPFFFFDESERLFLFFFEESLSAASAGEATGAAKETIFPVFFVCFFFVEAPRCFGRAPFPFSDVELTLDLRLVISFKSAAVAILVSLATNSFKFSGVTLCSLLTFISAAAVAGSVR